MSVHKNFVEWYWRDWNKLCKKELLPYQGEIFKLFSDKFHIDAEKDWKRWRKLLNIWLSMFQKLLIGYYSLNLLYYLLYLLIFHWLYCFIIKLDEFHYIVLSIYFIETLITFFIFLSLFLHRYKIYHWII